MADNDKFKEDSYEQAVIALFRDELKYDYEYGYDIERDLHEPYYRSVLEESVRRLNPKLSADAVRLVVDKVTQPGTGGIVQMNEAFTEMLQSGVEVQTMATRQPQKREKGIRAYVTEDEDPGMLMAAEDEPQMLLTQRARLIDYDEPTKNDFRIVNQWRVSELQNIRCDVVVFVNGLPLVVIELKSASDEGADIQYAYNQVRNYMLFAPSLFSYNAFNVISDMAFTKAGTITAKLDRYMDWKSIDGSYESTKLADYRTFFLGLFAKERLINILRNYICFDRHEGDVRKILTAYHQYYAVEKAMVRTHQAIEQRTGKIGVFWHTQGSGKSLSMVFYAHQLIQKLAECTIVVVTDRKDLDNQLYGQFSRCKDFLRQTPQNASSRQELKTLLEGRKAGGIIFTTIQKFEEGDGCLSDRRNIIVMTDEAHRSQYGEERWDMKASKMKKGYALKMREALPNASFIGYTGTPISDRDRDTEEVFGKYIDIYDMTQAVEDNATRPVYYESRVVNLSLNEETLELLDREFENLEANGATEEQIRQAKRDHSHLEQILGDDKTITSLVIDIIGHYEHNRQQECTGKAMIVALTRSIAIKIYHKILELRPDWTEKVKVVMSTSNKDPEEWTRLIGNDQQKKELARKFKDDNDPMKIAIVRDMWLTGFDVPSMATMYVYKPMKGHNLMQAITRVNRVFPGKVGGLIVDYVGIAQALKAAMKTYTQRDQNRYGNPDIAREALGKLKEEQEICRNLMHGFNYDKFFDESNSHKAEAITDAVNFMLDTTRSDDVKLFVEHSQKLHNASTLCRSLLVRRDKLEIAFFDSVRAMIAKLSAPGRITPTEISDRISNLINQSIRTEGVINLFGDKKVEFSLFNEAFIEEVRKMKQRNLAAQLLQKLLKEKIKRSMRTNVVVSELFSDMLSMSLSQYLKGLLTNDEVIEELLKLAEQMRREEEDGNNLGLTDEEKAFYDALSRPEGCKQAFNDEEFVQLTKELTETLHKNRTIDWNRKESSRAQMRIIVKRLLKKYKYPPEGAEEALDIVMKQCDHWADQEENFEGAVVQINNYGTMNLEHAKLNVQGDYLDVHDNKIMK